MTWLGFWILFNFHFLEAEICTSRATGKDGEFARSSNQLNMSQFLLATVLLACAISASDGFTFGAKALVGRINSLTNQFAGSSPVVAPQSTLLRMATKEAMPKVDSMGDGMFTTSSPETKRVIPTSYEGKRK
jgi:hypothetical protein